MIGPILVNSYHRTEPRTKRDPSDKDGRADIDFDPPNTTSAQLKAFRSAFLPSGYIWVWGCNFPGGYNSFFSKVQRNSKYSPSVDDEAIFDIGGLDKYEKELLNIYLYDRLKDPVTGARVKLRFADIKTLACRALTSCYSHQIARRVGIVTYGALVGTDAEYDKLDPPLMAVNSRFARRFKFYKDHFGIDLDPERRNYGRFLPTFECAG
jgi:hypothetical protein